MTQQEHVTRNEEVVGSEGPYDEQDPFRRGQQRLGTVGWVLTRDSCIDRNHIRVNVLSEWEALLEHHGFAMVEVLGSTYMGVLEAGWKMRAMKVVDRFALRLPTLATGLVIVATPQQVSG